MKPNLYVMCGLPGSGKTTYSKKLANQTGYKLYSFDSLPGSRDPKYAKDIKIKMYNNILQDLLNGINVILDDLNTKKEWRMELLSIFHGIPCYKTLILMTTPYKECQRRNKARIGEACLPSFIIAALNKDYAYPSNDEGWDKILIKE